MRLRALRGWGWILVALLLCASVAWPAEMSIWGRDLICADGNGRPLLPEDLLRGDMAHIYPWLAAADTLYAQSNAAADTGYVILEGLDSTWTEMTDSVLVRGTTRSTLPGQWYRVNRALWRDDEDNVGRIRVFSTAYWDTSAVLAEIPPGENRSHMAIYTMPAGRTKIVPMGWRVTHVATTLQDTFYAATLSLLARAPGDVWRDVDQIVFQVGQGPVVTLYDSRVAWELYPRSDLRVAAAITGSAVFWDGVPGGLTQSIVDVSSRFDFGVR